MAYINIESKNQDELWNLLQGVIPQKYLDHWLSPEELKSFKKEIKFKDGKKLTVSEILKLLSQNGYNIQEIKQSVGEDIVGTVRISE